MNMPPNDAVLERLQAGDAGAAEELFAAYEPYLRMVVRRQLNAGLRTKFDSQDVVQSVWVHMLNGLKNTGRCFNDVEHLQAFLVQLTRHRFIDRLRRHRQSLDRERSFEPDEATHARSADPSASQVAQAEDLWERLIDICPPEHRELLHLKRSGADNAEVAERIGLHEGSVRRILSTLAKRLHRP